MSWKTIPEAARHVRSGKERIYEAIYNGELRACKLSPNSPLIVNVEELDAWVYEHPVEKKAPAGTGA